MKIKASLNVFDDIKHQEIKEVFFNVLQWIESFNNRLKKKVKNSQQTTYQNKQTKKSTEKEEKCNRKRYLELKGKKTRYKR